MLVIRLFRTGKKKQPSYKVVVTDKKNPPQGGKFVEQLGFYNPLTKEKSFNNERIKHWLEVGAQPSDTIHNILINESIIKGEKKKVIFKKKKKEEKVPAQPAPVAKVPEVKKEEVVPEPVVEEAPKTE
ncbi:MAG: 30S ribosomal protein S16 [Candidatus Pacebacteria bacterium]|nr:30S ribosomal protein S16 [Candidatus Paceibacterota bacterium]